MVVDTFAEAFPMTAARVIVTAVTRRLGEIAGQTMTGYATSVIACDAEAGIERELRRDRDARRPSRREYPGLRVQSRCPGEGRVEPGRAMRDDLSDDRLLQRTTARREDDQRGRPAAVFRRWLADLEADRRPAVLAHPDDGRRVPLRGDLRDDQRGRGGQYHRAWGPSPPATLEATERAAIAMRRCPDIILPFPGGIARSGSKVGSKYKGLRASTNTAFAPILRGVVPTEMPPEARCVYEIVIDGLSLEAVERATAAGLHAATQPGNSILGVTAGNYGGKLGPFPIRLHDVLNRYPAPT